MSPKAGDRLGPYEILAPIGAGGMGEVYRAHDTRLRRDVAIKICNENFSERFEREARSIAALNHPHICQLYDVGPNYLVMELIEGESLKGPYPLDEALRFAAQIAEALEAAHEKGIVHRDLKPANIMIASGGVVKVLDFGLAKAAEEPATANPQNSPTITMSPTRAGMILGTAAYMSPEQARGKQVDKRADIWAFGVVLYEMLTGKQLFHGETAGDTLAAVLKEEPNLDRVPTKVRPLLRCCLEKDPKKRLRDIGDAMPLLEDSPNVVGPSRSRVAWLAWGVAALAILAAAGLGFIHFRDAPPAGNMLSLSVALPPDTAPIFLALSPDGRRLAISLAHEGKYQLYLRPLDSPEYRLLTGTDLVWMPFWSDDSRFIGFFAEGKLKTIPAAGGPATALCGETGLGKGGTWNRDGVILFSGDDFILRRVNASGGACTVAKLGDNTRVATPQFLPDGNHFLYVDVGNPADPSSAGVYLAALDNPKASKVLNDRSTVLYAPPASGKGPAYLLFLRGTTLMAQPFDAAKLETVGDPLAAVQQASYSTYPQIAASVALNGTLVYLVNRRQPQRLTSFDRSGDELGKIGPAGDQGGVSLSPDGNAVAVSQYGQAGGIWLFGVARNSQIRFTPSGRNADSAVWSPDASRIVYTAQNNLFLKDVNGGQETPLLPPSANSRYASDWSRDGRFLIYSEIDPTTRSDIWYLPDPGKPGGKPVKFLGTSAMESQGQLSPDGRWLAYFSDESGDRGVYIRPFPAGTGVWQVSANGAREPRWNRNGKELFYMEGNAPARRLMTAAIQPEANGGLQIGAPHKLFESRGPAGVPQFNQFAYSPQPDGKRFLVNVFSETAKPAINVITNWQKLIAERVP